MLCVAGLANHKEPLIGRGRSICSECLADVRCLTVVYPGRTVVVVNCDFCKHQALITGPTVPGPHA